MEAAQLERTPAQRDRAASQREGDEYRTKKFKPAKSGNGWTYQTIVDGWFVTRWVGKRLSTDRACVFPPSWKNDYGVWVKATEEPLIEQPCNNVEEAFKYLQDLDHRGIIEQLARKAIDEYNSPLSTPDTGPDDDIPF